jgi:hypothetical protein
MSPLSAETPSRTGVVASRPSAVRGIGTWVVGGESFEVTSVTTLDDSGGSVGIDGCVTVEYVVTADGNDALRIAGEEPSACR